MSERESKSKSKVLADFAEGERRRAEELAEAERVARETGKEPFDWPQFLASGRRPHGEHEHRVDYYVLKPEIRTMAEYIALRKELEPWE